MIDQAGLPLPLVPAEVDLRDFGFMPLDVRTLLTSSLWIKSKKDPRVAHAAVSLWSECWHQVPAASLPDDDEVLADLARCDEREWKRIRERALLHFVKCSDGRMYHRYIAVKALEAWTSKLAQRSRTKAATEARAKKHRARDDVRDEERGVKRDEQRDVARDVDRDVHQGTGTGTGTGIEKHQPPSVPVDPRPQLSLVALPVGGPGCPHDAIIEAWHRLLPTLPRVKGWSPTRRSHLAERWRFDPKRQRLDWWERLFAFTSESDFMLGNVPPRDGRRKVWRLTLPWLVESEEHLLKVIEGNYHEDQA